VREGIDLRRRVRRNVMIDTLYRNSSAGPGEQNLGTHAAVCRVDPAPAVNVDDVTRSPRCSTWSAKSTAVCRGVALHRAPAATSRIRFHRKLDGCTILPPVGYLKCSA